MAMDNENSEQAQERKEKPLNDLLTPSMVHIYVGSENTHWYIHERLLCYYSPFFSDIFYADDKNPEKTKAQRNKAYGLPEEEDLAFEMLVGWLYSRSIKVPTEEKDVGPLLDLYLLSEKLKMDKLSNELVEAISDYYYRSQTYPSLRRVQHIYANTDDDNAMREMMVGAVAKLLTTSEKIPAHWASALQRNGQLAVDIIRSIQLWKIEETTIPDARDRSSSRGRSAKGGFSTIDREGTESMETDKTGITSNLGVESLNSEADGEHDHSMGESKELKSENNEAPLSHPRLVAISNDLSLSPPPNYSAVTSPDPAASPPPAFTSPAPHPEIWQTPSSTDTPTKPKKPPDEYSNLHSILVSPSSRTSSGSPARLALRSKPSSSPPSSVASSLPSKRRLSVTFSDQVNYSTYTFFPSGFGGTQESPFPPLQIESGPDKLQEPWKDHTDGETTNVEEPGTNGLGIEKLRPLDIDDENTKTQVCGILEELEKKTSSESTKPKHADVEKQRQKTLMNANASPEAVMLGFLWMLYLGWLAKF